MGKRKPIYTPDEMPGAIHRLQELQVRRKFYIGLVNRQTNAGGALIRRGLGWTKEDDGGIKKRAARIMAAFAEGKEAPAEDAAVAEALAFDLAVLRQCVEPLEKARHEVELEMCRMVRRLPVTPWAAAVKGFGEKALAVVIGEAGDLSKYSSVEKLWKRLGLAPLDGHAMSTWRSKGGLTAEQWTTAGYSGQRRAQTFACIDAALIRTQTTDGGHYRVLYDDRRLRTAQTHPDWTKGHSHNDACRIVTKQLISDLWSEWRRSIAELSESSVEVVTAATLSIAA